jgi:hypothetical protein
MRQSHVWHRGGGSEAADQRDQRHSGIQQPVLAAREKFAQICMGVAWGRALG